MKVRKKLTKLTPVSTRFISLVHRSNSQVPFRILKQDGSLPDEALRPEVPPADYLTPHKESTAMLNLSSLNLFRTKTPEEVAKKAPPFQKKDDGDGKDKEDAADTKTDGKKPNPFAKKVKKEQRVVAVVVGKGANMELVAKSLADEGFVVLDPAARETTEDGSMVFKMEEFTEADTVVVRQSANLALVCKGFDSYKAATASFNERLGIQNYYNGVDTASRALTYAINSAISEAGSPEEAMVAIDNITGEFSDYIAGLVEGLPEQCFTPNLQHVMKAAEVVAVTLTPEEVEKAAKCPDCGMSMVHKCAGSVKKAEEPAVTVPVVAPIEAAPAPAVVEPAPVVPAVVVAPVVEVVPAPVVVEKADPSIAFAKALADIASTLSEVKKSQEDNAAKTADAINTLTKRTDEIAAKTAESVQKADKTAAKLAGALPGVGSPEDKPVKVAEVVVKSDSLGEGFDTAFMPRKW